MISRSCIKAISTGTAYFHSNRSAMYAEITSSEAMIAMTALLATVLPNVGPIDFSEKCLGAEAFVAGSCSTFVSGSAGCSVLVEIW